MTTPSDPDPTLALDPEEDDLDDLDDVLDSFDPKPTAKAAATTSSAPLASGPGRPPTSSSAIADDEADPTLPSDADLAKDLQAGMANLISELGENKEMQSQFEAMMAELIAAGQAPTDAQAAEHVKSASESMPQMPASAKEAIAGGKKEENFQETIRRTMERMQESDSTAKNASSSSTAAAGAGGDEEQMLLELMKSLNAGGAGAGAEGGEEDFNAMLMSMMTQLTNKEILYEPMKELHEKYPAWMEAHAATEKKEDMVRYAEQQRLVGEIVGRFERKGYSDEDEGDREYIVERMQKMQAAGSPPSDLVGDTAAAQQALGDLDAGCPTQ